MTVIMIILIILAYIALWFFVIKCNKIIKNTDEEGHTSRDIIKKGSR